MFVYGGLANNITTPAPIAISSTVKGSPTTVNTSAPHNLLNGDIIDITGHQVCSGANGAGWTVTVTSSTQFTIPSNTSTYVSGGATGHVWAKVYTQNRTSIPVDGDPNLASTYAPMGMSNADENTFNFSQLSLYRFANGSITNPAVNTDPTFGGGSPTPWAYVQRG